MGKEDNNGRLGVHFENRQAHLAPTPLTELSPFSRLPLRFGNTLSQKDQAVHTCRQCPNAIGKLIGVMLKLSHPGFKRTRPLD